MSKLNDDMFIAGIHQRTDLSEYLEVLYKQRQIGPVDFEQLARHCLAVTQTSVQPFKTFRRFERLWALLRFQLYALQKCRGPLAECGVFRGFSGLAMGLLMKAVADSAGPPLRDLWLVDSYAGLSEPVEYDWITQSIGGLTATGPSMQKGHFATPLETVEKHFTEITNAKFAKGWIPQVFNLLPASEWSFVHIDVDLYGPVSDCLKYFYPKLEKGGVMINDDFNSALFPGAGKAWHEFFETIGKGYAVLDTGQAVFLNN
jgi:O-methyltransferase